MKQHLEVGKIVGYHELHEVRGMSEIARMKATCGERGELAGVSDAEL